MGSLRLFLAISVLADHTTGIGPLQLAPASTAVWLFFIISGFYMQMIASGKYGNRIWTFYTNRALRLYPTYFVAAAIAIPNILPTLPAAPLKFLTIGANTTLFGGDVLFYLGQHGRLLVPPAWSIGLELWFYLLVPLLARCNFLILLGTMAASGALAFHMEEIQPWSSYFFFPANFYLFGAGMLAYRSMRCVSESPRPWRSVIFVVAVAGFALLVFRPIIPGFRNYAWAQEIVLIASLPFIFATTHLLSWDRAIGNLSYSVYLLHEPVMSWLGSSPSGIETVAITIPLAVATYILVERPLDRWRQKRVRDPAFKASSSAA